LHKNLNNITEDYMDYTNIALLVIFLALNLIVGLYYGRGVKNIKEYALGNRKFNTGTLVATIVATWIGGDYLFITLEEVYNTGLHYAVACCGMAIQMFLIAYLFVPRMGEFLGNISIAEAMGDLYGKHVRIISAITGSIGNCGIIAVQFKVFGSIFSYFLGVPPEYTVFAAAAITIFYSAFGGLRSVTFTDVIQFFTFGVLIPVIAIVIWMDVYKLPSFTFANIAANPIFDWREFVGGSNPKFWEMMSLMFLFILPGFEPAVFQRIAIGRSIQQVSRAFYLGAIVILVILLSMVWIGFLIFQLNPNLESSDLVYYILQNYGNGGLKSFILIGIVAMCMSTADSQINSSAVLLTHDFCHPLKIGFKNELFQSKIFAVLIGIASIFLASTDWGMLEIVFVTQNFYAPIVGVPFILAILGFRSTTKAALIGIGAASITVGIWELFYSSDTGIDSLLTGSLVNIIFFMGSHYLLKQEGGWVGVKYTAPLENAKIERKYKISQLVENIKNFNFIDFCKNNSPKYELTYTGFGIFGAISSLCTMYATSMAGIEGKDLIIFYETMLIVSVLFITYPVWPSFLKQDNVIQISWYASLFYLLIFCSGFFLLISNFSHLQLVIFTVNLIAVAILTRWQLAFIMVIAGMWCSINFYKYYAGCDHIEINIDSTLLMFYSILLSGAVVLIFLKPKQEHQDLTEKKAKHLGGMILNQEEELKKLVELKYEFLRNIEHEINTPITGIVSLGQTLVDNYENLDDSQIRYGLETIAKSSERFDSLVKNLLNLSKLSSLSYKLNKEELNLSNLIYDRITICKKLYLDNKDLEFIAKIEPNITAYCDEYYISNMVDNLIINAITYSDSGKITIALINKENTIEFSIADEGIGIPEEELLDIFGAFVVGAKTKTPSGGRGVGLTVCKKIAEAHNGKIWAKNNLPKGTEFVFTLPNQK
jgi:Na+/proline symporter/signal transduction histidine kinase